MSIFIIISLIGLAVDSNTECKVIVRLSDGIKKINIADIYLTVSIIILFVICALRDVSIGVDTKNYVNTFLNKGMLATLIDGESKFEIGYIFYINFLRTFTDNPQVYIFITSLILFVGTYIFVKNNCTGSYSLSIVIFMAFLYYTYFSAIRQSIALVIAINSFNYIYNRQWLKASSLIILAGSFHYTALVLLAFIPLSLTKWTKKKILIAFAASVIAVFLFDRIVEFVIQIFPIYRRYWDSGMMQADDSNGGTFAFLVMSICIFAFINLLKNKDKLLSDQERAFYISALTGSIFCVFINVLGLSQGIFSRMSRYFIPYVIVLTASTYKIYIKKYRIFFYIGVVFLMGSYFYLRMRSNIYQIIPYKFFFGGI